MIGISNDKNISPLVLEYITLLEKEIKAEKDFDNWLSEVKNQI